MAQCTPPHVLTNGTVADATEVMDNITTVAQCADDAAENSVTQTGSPQIGDVAVFSGDKTVTGGNLTGDVTTSGGTETTLAPSGVVAGTYTNSTIAVDEKGRVTSAVSGAGGPSGAASLILISRVVVDGTSSSVSFSSIPQVFQDLVLVVSGQSVNPRQNLFAYANGDTANGNYRDSTCNRFGTGVLNAPCIGTFPGLNIPSAGTAVNFRTEFYSYASSIWKKNAMSDAQYEDSANFFRNKLEWKWNSTAPITDLTLQIASGNIANGTTFSLYGRGEN
ncbi:MAG: hypothetical protein ABJP48_10075 [Erythrobacter sp.]